MVKYTALGIMKQMADEKPEIKIIIGLGNPGKEYENTYHNAGSLFVDYLKKYAPDAKFQILNSNAFMNEAGLFVRKSLKKYGVKPKNLLVAHDDSDIAFGKYKISFNRGAAGHKGVESVIANLGGEEFWRLRIGVRRAREKGQASAFVLKKIGKTEREILGKTFVNIAGNENLFAG